MNWMDKLHKIKVHMSFAPAKTKVWLDDVEVRGLVGVDIKHHAGEEPVVVLKLYPRDSEVEIASDEPLTMQVVKAG